MTFGLPFQVQGNALRTMLTADRLTPVNQVLGVMSAVAFYDGPLGHLLLYKGGEPFRFFIKGRHQTNAPGAGDFNVDLRAAGFNPVRSTRQAPEFPTQAHPDVLAYTSVDNGATWQIATVKAVNFATGAVTMTAPAACLVAVYFTVGNGEYEIRLIRPMGSDVTSAKLADGALRSIHETDQTNDRSLPRFGMEGREYPQPPQFRLELAVRTNTPIVWDRYAQHEISLPVFDTPVKITDPARMNAEAEVKLRGGSL